MYPPGGGLERGADCPVAVAAWDEPLDRIWRDSILDAVRADERWAFVFNGSSLRIVDAHRTWSRQYLEFDLALLSPDEDAFALLWRVARAESLGASPRLLDRAVDLCARHGVAICAALAEGVLDALELLLRTLRERRTRSPAPALLDQSLTVVYRILFLLFAEARGLVPVWHPVYRDRYTIDSIVSTLLAGQRYRGVWSAVNAISRLAHNGCVAGELKVTAFNGRLFSPSATGAVDRTRIDDDVMAEAVLAISTAPAVARQRTKANRLSRSRRRGTRGGVRTGARLRAPSRRARSNARSQEVYRGVLHASSAHVVSLCARRSHRSSQVEPPTRSCDCGFPIPRWAAAPSWSPLVRSWPRPPRRPSSTKDDGIERM